MLTAIFAAYPNAAMNEFTADAYWAELRAFPLDVVRAAFAHARRESPQWIPTGPMVAAHARALEKVAADGPRQTYMPSLDDVDSVALPVDHPAMALARRYAKEDAEAGRSPERCTPREIAEERLREIVALLNNAPAMVSLKLPKPKTADEIRDAFGFAK